MALFSIAQRNSAEDRLAEIEKAQRVSAIYDRANQEMVATEKALMLWAFTGSPEAVLDMTAHAEAFNRSLAELKATGGPAEVEFVTAMEEYVAAFTPLFSEVLGAGEQAPERMANLEAEFNALYDELLARIGDEDSRQAGVAPSSVWYQSISPMSGVITRRAEAEQARVADLSYHLHASWDQQTPFVLAVYAAGTALVLVLLVGTFVMSRREARANAEIGALRRAVTTDPLTGLGNRRGFEEELKRLSANPDAQLSLAIMDLDEFKEANDTFGHDRGDSILRAFAGLLTACAPESVSCFRIGGDEFALVLPGIAPERTLEICERVRSHAAEKLGNGVTVSTGVARLAGDESLLRQQADAALYEAKLRGRNIVVLYHDDALLQPLFPAAKLAAVRQLLVEGKVRAFFQPIWDLHAGTLLAYEALSRPDESYGLSGPQQAFDIAERFGRAADLDRICRKHIFEAARSLPPEVDIFVNLSPYTLTHQSFEPGQLLGEIAAEGLGSHRVVFEITERSQVAPEAIAEGVSRLRKAGFRVALDDVGSGNNGLEMLRKVEFEYVKVDRAVLLSAQESGSGRAALMAILAFSAEARALVVAEGIEDERMFGLVKEVTHAAVKGTPGLIHGVQGYLFGRPAAAENLAGEPPDALAA
jgi:diguanylate cyclase (GGDEF)-like protein